MLVALANACHFSRSTFACSLSNCTNAEFGLLRTFSINKLFSMPETSASKSQYFASWLLKIARGSKSTFSVDLFFRSKKLETLFSILLFELPVSIAKAFQLSEVRFTLLSKYSRGSIVIE